MKKTLRKLTGYFTIPTLPLKDSPENPQPTTLDFITNPPSPSWKGRLTHMFLTMPDVVIGVVIFYSFFMGVYLFATDEYFMGSLLLGCSLILGLVFAIFWLLAHGNIDQWRLYTLLKDSIPLEAELIGTGGEYWTTYMGGIRTVFRYILWKNSSTSKTNKWDILILESNHRFEFMGKDCHFMALYVPKGSRFSEMFFVCRLRYFGMKGFLGTVAHVYHTILGQVGWLRDDIPLFIAIHDKQIAKKRFEEILPQAKDLVDPKDLLELEKL